MNKPNIMSVEYIVKLNELGAKIQNVEKTGTSDEIGAIEAILMQAIQYGFDLAKKQK